VSVVLFTNFLKAPRRDLCTGCSLWAEWGEVVKTPLHFPWYLTERCDWPLCNRFNADLFFLTLLWFMNSSIYNCDMSTHCWVTQQGLRERALLSTSR
jgi:hypothetical protein